MKKFSYTSRVCCKIFHFTKIENLQFFAYKPTLQQTLLKLYKKGVNFFLVTGAYALACLCRHIFAPLYCFAGIYLKLSLLYIFNNSLTRFVILKISDFGNLDIKKKVLSSLDTCQNHAGMTSEYGLVRYNYIIPPPYFLSTKNLMAIM